MVAIVLAHGLLGWGLLQISAVRATLVAAAPMMFSMVDAAKTPSPPPPRPAPQVAAPAPVIATSVVDATSEFAVAEPEPETTPVVTSAPADAEPAPALSPPAPKLIPASAIQYRVPPPLEYPRASRKLREAGRTIVRVYVDETGTPLVTQIKTSSGFARLDEAALAAVQKARFKPYTENGVPTAGWAVIPLDFELET